MSSLARFVKRYATAVAGSAYAFTLGMRSNRHRRGTTLAMLDTSLRTVSHNPGQ